MSVIRIIAVTQEPKINTYKVHRNFNATNLKLMTQFI